jgi:hypothetical protein
MALDQNKRMEHKETDENVAFLNSWGAQLGPNYQSKGTLGLSSDRFNRVQNRRNGRR